MRADIEAAYAWYEAQQTGLGDNFRSALTIVWRLLDQFPKGGPDVHRDLRGYLFHISRTQSIIALSSRASRGAVSMLLEVHPRRRNPDAP